MRQFDYREKWKKLLTPEIVAYLSQIHEFKGAQTLFIEVIHCCSHQNILPLNVYQHFLQKLNFLLLEP